MVELFFVEVKYFQHGIMWVDLDLLYSIHETSYQYFGCFIHLINQIINISTYSNDLTAAKKSYL